MAVNNRYSEIKKSDYDNDFIILTSRLKPKNQFKYAAFDLKAADEKICELDRQREANKNRFKQSMK